MSPLFLASYNLQKTKELNLPLTSSNTQKCDTAPKLDGTVELSLWLEVWVAHPGCCETSHLSPLLIWHVAWEEERCSSLQPTPGSSTSEKLEHSEEQSLPIVCTTQESWPWCYRCVRADPESIEARELGYPLVHCFRRWISGGNTGGENLSCGPTFQLPRSSTGVITCSTPASNLSMIW